MWAASDDALLAGLGAGDPDGARAFVRRFQGAVFGLALAVLGDAAAAEDVAQDAFVRAWRHAESFDARRGSVLTWLLTITRNLAIDALRMRRAMPVDPAALAAMTLASPDRTDEVAAERLEAARLRAALDGLPAEQRRALVLAAFRGRSAREIAELDSIPLGTAKTRIRTAMLKLRDALAVRYE
jgi:RNA polymerase sigma-70 factor (ECF subfamily)